MHIYNTLTGKKEEFRPIGNLVLIYVCGVTTYDRPHLGHALSSIVFDVLHRYLEYIGYKVKRVQNFTDVDDKIINRAKEKGITSLQLANENVKAFLEDMDALNVRRATVHPRVTNEIPQIIKMISDLVNRGAAYESYGSVYFRVSSFSGYGKLSRRDVTDLMEDPNLANEVGKETPVDFALWKAAKPGEPAWISPWGKGRPGWHIECSAMALHHLGEKIDIHGGGLDLVFPHHENELAQTETALGIEPFASIWMHNGLLKRSGDQKMSKSLGNVVDVKPALEKNSPDAIRLWVIQSHYRSPSVLDDNSIDSAEVGLARIRATNELTSNHKGKKLDPSLYREQFIEAMDDDLNTPRGVAVIFDLCREINRSHAKGLNTSDGQILLRELTDVFGLSLKKRVPKPSNVEITDHEIELLIEQRRVARAEKRFTDADSIREKLETLRITLSDGLNGTRWSRF